MYKLGAEGLMNPDDRPCRIVVYRGGSLFGFRFARHPTHEYGIVLRLGRSLILSALILLNVYGIYIIYIFLYGGTGGSQRSTLLHSSVSGGFLVWISLRETPHARTWNSVEIKVKLALSTSV